jgi:hypothetical protein
MFRQIENVGYAFLAGAGVLITYSLARAMSVI